MKKHNIENWTLGGIVGTTVLSGLLLSFPYASADDGAISNVAIRVNSACSIAVSPESSNDTPHTADLNPGTYQANIGKTTIKTTCNDSNGFSIYAIGYTDEEYGNTVLKPDTVDSSNSIITGTATGAISGIDTSNWAMKISAVSGDYAPTIETDTDGSYSSYHKVPSAYTKVATKSSVTDITAGSSIEITYAAYIADTQPADLYNGKVKFTMVHPATEPAPYTGETTQSGRICYYSGVTDSEGTMGCQNVASGVTLLASNFSRTGYGFAGWTDKFDYTTNNTAKYYGPNETITIPDTSIYAGEGKGLSLYAVWIKSAGSLQDSEKVATLCGAGSGSLTTAPTDGTANRSSVSALTDERDNQTYAIARLADGNCWTIENLRLESTASHNTDGTLAQGYNSSFVGLASAESSWANESTTANSLYSTDGANGTTNIGTSNAGNRFPRYNNTNVSTRTSNPSSNSNANLYSYGNYYTWAAAIADTTNYTSGDHGTTSICPKGWRLPIGYRSTVDKSFGKLSVSLGGPTGGAEATTSSTPTGATMSSIFRSYPNNFVFPGSVHSGSVYYRGSAGYYLSSTVYDTFNVYALYLNWSKVGTTDVAKFVGMSIRCVAIPSI